ncbi:MAG: triose-phosphate isomerase [Oscillospiraceae bacterium]|jgi:triosephosphate isomerase|nr:triose-phosphate isomerase [Oscillospiraceae bacterium]
MIIAANWKMNKTILEVNQFLDEFVSLVGENKHNKIIIAPSFVFLQKVIKFARKKNIKVFAQNCHQFASGAFTGEVSASMLSSIGVNGVILGHGERKAMGETCDMVNQKLKMAICYNLEVILCTGESENNRAEKEIEFQIKTSLKDINTDEKICIAYEPLWAIGSNKSASCENIYLKVKFIRDICKKMGFFNTKILYGGSVNLKNYVRILNIPKIDGILVGGASLKSKDFAEISSFNSSLH